MIQDITSEVKFVSPEISAFKMALMEEDRWFRHWSDNTLTAQRKSIAVGEMLLILISPLFAR